MKSRHETKRIRQPRRTQEEKRKLRTNKYEDRPESHKGSHLVNFKRENNTDPRCCNKREDEQRKGRGGRDQGMKWEQNGEKREKLQKKILW